MSHARRVSILSLLVASVGGSLTSAQVGSVLAEHEIGGASFLLTVPLDLALLGTPHHLQGLCTGAPGTRLGNALDVVVGW